jgi:hypothetical protein
MDSFWTALAQMNPTIIPLGAIVTFMVVGLIRGWVVPRQVMTDRIADKDAQIIGTSTERDSWKDAYFLQDEAKRELIHQNSDLISGGETTTRLMESMRNYIERLDPTKPPPPFEPPPETKGGSSDAKGNN